MSNIPVAVRERAKQILALCNHNVTMFLSSNPAEPEVVLDSELIRSIRREAGVPQLVDGNWTVTIETHSFASIRLYKPDPALSGFEIADIVVRVVFASGGKVIRTKVALLQSKRLDTKEVLPLPPSAFWWPEHTWMASNDEVAEAVSARTFSFDEQSIYDEITLRDRQFTGIGDFERESELEVCYLLYNPAHLPYQVQTPLQTPFESTEAKIGCRVIPTANVREIMEAKDVTHPSYALLRDNLGSEFKSELGWRLEDFIIDRVFECKSGNKLTEKNHKYLQRGYLRRLPNVAAISVFLNGPDGFNWSFDE